MVRKLGFVLVLVLQSTTVLAATINMQACPIETEFSCITSIDNLEVDGDFYDVTIQQTSFNDLFGEPGFFYWGDSDWATTAARSIADALNLLNPIPTTNDTKFIDNFSSNILHLPTTFASNGVNFSSSCVQMVSVGQVGSGTCVSWTPDGTYAFATFSPVPVPPAIWLFGSGLIGLIGVVRRKKP